MANLHFFLLGVLTLHYVSAAPSDISGLEEITQKENEESHDKHATSLDDIKGHGNSKQAKRHKRMYDFYVGGGHPPMNPIGYPSYGPPPYAGGYAPPTLEDPLAQIYKKLQDIASEVRRQSRPPPPPPHPPQQFPVYFPVIYIPQVSCGCNPNQPSPKPSTTNGNGTSPDINSRFPAMEDSRQNWGFVEMAKNNDNADEDDDYVRPLSFEPLAPNRPLGRSPPAVDHGSREGDAQATQTIMPPFLAAASSSASSSTNLNSVPEPTACDAAVFVCCDRFKEKYSGCFIANGCTGIAENGNNCDESIIANVIAKYQRYYGQIRG